MIEHWRHDAYRALKLPFQGCETTAGKSGRNSQQQQEANSQNLEWQCNQALPDLLIVMALVRLCLPHVWNFLQLNREWGRRSQKSRDMWSLRCSGEAGGDTTGLLLGHHFRRRPNLWRRNKEEGKLVSPLADISRLAQLGNPTSSTSRQADIRVRKKIDCQLRAVIDPIRSDNTKEEREVR